MADWSTVVPQLCKQADVAAIDLPGFGASPTPRGGDERLTLGSLAADVIAVLDVLEWDSPILVGHSHGAAVALMAAAVHPQRVAALVLVSSLGSPTHTAYRLLAAPGMQQIMNALAGVLRVSGDGFASRAVIRRSLGDACSPERVPSELFEQTLAMFCAAPQILRNMVQLARHDPSGQVLAAAERITCPVSFVHGELDAVVPIAHAKTIHRRILAAGGRSSFREVSAAGHLLPYFQPNAVVHAVTELTTSG